MVNEQESSAIGFSVIISFDDYLGAPVFPIHLYALRIAIDEA